MAETDNVTVADVRLALNNVDATEFEDAVIEQKLTQARIIIEQGVEDVADIPQDHYEMAVTEVAAFRAFTSAPAEMKRAALDLSVTYDVQTYVNNLEDRRDEALALVGVSKGGKSAAFAGKTDGALSAGDDREYDSLGDVE